MKKLPEKDQTYVKISRHHVNTIAELIKIIIKWTTVLKETS